MSAQAVYSAQRLVKGGQTKTGIASGWNSGFVVTKRVPRTRSSQNKAKAGKRVKLVRNVVREVAGFAPYEKRIQELLKSGGVNPMKRTMRFARNRLGSHQRAKRKVAEMQDAIQK